MPPTRAAGADTTQIMHAFVSDLAGDTARRKVLLIRDDFRGHRDSRILVRQALRRLRQDAVVRQEHREQQAWIVDDSVRLEPAEIHAMEAFYKEPPRAWTAASAGGATLIPSEAARSMYAATVRYMQAHYRLPPEQEGRVLIASARPFIFREASLALVLYTEIDPEINQIQLLLYRFRNGVWTFVASVYGMERSYGSIYWR